MRQTNATFMKENSYFPSAKEIHFCVGSQIQTIWNITKKTIRYFFTKIYKSQPK